MIAAAARLVEAPPAGGEIQLKIWIGSAVKGLDRAVRGEGDVA